MKKILLFLLVGILSIGIASAWSETNLTYYKGLCYQNLVDVATDCGGLNTGTISFSGTGVDVGKAYDGDYNSFSYGDFTYSFNYTKPSIMIGAILEIKDSDGYANLTVPSSCYNSYVSNLSFKVVQQSTPQIAWYCKNSTDWQTLKITTSGNKIYEKAIYWINNSNVLPSILNFKYSNSLENLWFNFDKNFTRYIDIPSNINWITNMKMNISSIFLPAFVSNEDAYYRFEELSGTTVVDYSTRVNPGTTSPGGLTKGYNGSFGYSYSFDRTGLPYITINGATIGYTAPNISINVWIKNYENISGTHSILGGGGNSYAIYMYNGGILCFGKVTASEICSKTFNITDNTWTMITMIYNATGVNFYINGQFKENTSYSATFATSASYAIGAVVSVGDYMNGSIDELRVFNRSLTQTEISKLYTNNSLNSYSYINVTIGDSQIYFTNLTNNQSRFDFTSFANSYLSTCTKSDGYCHIPLFFNSFSNGTLQYSDLQFDNLGFTENNQTYNSSSYETSRENFLLNLSYDNNSYSITSANLNYNGTSYAGTITTNGTNALISSSLYVPIGTGNKSFYWTIGISNTTDTNYYNSTFKNQTINLLNMSICGAAPYNVPYLNYTFHNETLAGEAIKATFSTTFNYWLSDSSVYKTLNYVSAVENSSYVFCFSLNSTPIYASAIGTYDNSVSESRSFSNSSMLLTNVTTIKDLLLLPTSSGIYITFIVQNSYGAKISGALIDVKKTSGSVPVEQKYTDGTGSAAFWLSTSTAYTITFSASGYNTISTGITPVDSPVTITMTSTAAIGTGTPAPQDTISIIISPTGNILDNGTSYDFTYNISSTLKHFDKYGFSLWNKSSLLDSGDFGTHNHGETLSTNFNTGNQSYIVMKYYFVIDGEYTNNSYTWIVESTDGTSYSIVHGFKVLDTFTSNTSTGILGVKKGGTTGNFTFALILFLVIFFVAGIMTYKFGITSITATLFVIFSVVLFMDVGANLFANLNPYPAVPHFITIIMGLMTLGFFVKEMVT